MSLSLREYTQPTATPTPKVTAVGAVGTLIAAVVTILAFTGVIVPDGLPEQAEQAIQALFVIIAFGQAVLQFAAGYFKKDAKPFTVVQEIKKAGK